MSRSCASWPSHEQARPQRGGPRHGGRALRLRRGPRGIAAMPGKPCLSCRPPPCRDRQSPATLEVKRGHRHGLFALTRVGSVRQSRFKGHADQVVGLIEAHEDSTKSPPAFPARCRVLVENPTSCRIRPSVPRRTQSQVSGSGCFGHASALNSSPSGFSRLNPTPALDP